MLRQQAQTEPRCIHPYSLGTLFFLFSIAGWFCEVLFEFIFTQSFVNRGFLYGPYLPIYGFGILSITACRNKMSYIHKLSFYSLILLFLLSVFVATGIEYFTSFILERIFQQRWWDYSSFPFHYKGRICLGTSLLFGLGGVISYYWIIPAFNKHAKNISPLLYRYLNLLMCCLLLLDFYNTMKRMF